MEFSARCDWHVAIIAYDLARQKPPISSVVRASDLCIEGHGFDSLWGLGLFLCLTLIKN